MRATATLDRTVPAQLTDVETRTPESPLRSLPAKTGRIPDGLTRNTTPWGLIEVKNECSRNDRPNFQRGNGTTTAKTHDRKQSSSYLYLDICIQIGVVFRGGNIHLGSWRT
jgi:hypothetical protein